MTVGILIYPSYASYQVTQNVSGYGYRYFSKYLDMDTDNKFIYCLFRYHLFTDTLSFLTKYPDTDTDTFERYSSYMDTDILKVSMDA